MKTLAASILILFATFCLADEKFPAGAKINQDVTTSVRLKGEKFVFELNNNSKQPIYLLEYNHQLWCYQIVVWDTLRIGYSVVTKSSFAASENGAFLDPSKFSFKKVEPKDQLHFEFPFDDMAAEPDVMEKAIKMLSMKKSNTVFVRPEVTIMIEPKFESERIDIFGKLSQLQELAE